MHGVLGLLVGALTLLSGVVVMAQLVGKRTRLVVSGGAAGDIRRVCLACFSASRWVVDAGPGLINMRLLGRRSPRTVVSVSIEECGDGGYLVSVWCSEGPAWMELDDALLVRRIQDRIVTTVNALPSALGSRPSAH